MKEMSLLGRSIPGDQHVEIMRTPLDDNDFIHDSEYSDNDQ